MSLFVKKPIRYLDMEDKCSIKIKSFPYNCKSNFCNGVVNNQNRCYYANILRKKYCRGPADLIEWFRAGTFHLEFLSLNRNISNLDISSHYLKIGYSRPLFRLFSSFQANICENYPFSIWCWDSYSVVKFTVCFKRLNIAKKRPGMAFLKKVLYYILLGWYQDSLPPLIPRWPVPLLLISLEKPLTWDFEIF